MAEILWHRRETRRQTENTNVMPIALEGLILLDKSWNAPVHRRLHAHHHPAKESDYQMTSTGVDNLSVLILAGDHSRTRADRFRTNSALRLLSPGPRFPPRAAIFASSRDGTQGRTSDAGVVGSVEQ